MNESSQAIFDSIGNSFYGAGQRAYQAADIYLDAAYEIQRPSVLFKPALSIDGNQWCAMYGPSIQEGVCGFGDSPKLAMEAFDKAWREKLAPALSEPEVNHE
jgi:hypothetical protein